MRSTTSIKQSDIKEKWYLVDVKDKRIGRVATVVSQLLRGRNNPLVRPYHNPKVKIIIINAGSIDFTEKKGLTKFYKNYSGFPGGLKFVNLEDTFKKFPERPLQIAIKGMLPKTKKGDEIFSNLYIYPGQDHKHEAQRPELIDIEDIKL